jgi:hypothetical protein
MMRFFFYASPPKVFILGSTMLTTTLSDIEWVGGPGSDSPVVSPVEPPLKACGNDGLGTVLISRSKLRGI